MLCSKARRGLHFPYKEYNFRRHLLHSGRQMTPRPYTANVIFLLSLGKTRPLEVLNRCYKAVIKSLEYAFCLYLQMVSHAIKMSSVSKNADGKVINARFIFFNTSGLLPPSPCAFHLCQLHKRKGVSPVKQRNIFFLLLTAVCSLSPLFALLPHVQG